MRGQVLSVEVIAYNYNDIFSKLICLFFFYIKDVYTFTIYTLICKYIKKNIIM